LREGEKKGDLIERRGGLLTSYSEKWGGGLFERGGLNRGFTVNAKN